MRIMKERIGKRRNETEPRKIKFRLFSSKKRLLVKSGKTVTGEEAREKQDLGEKMDDLLSEYDLSEALEDIFARSTKEVESFNEEKYLKKIAVREGEILFSKNRIMDGYELKVLGELAGSVDIGQFRNMNFKVPLIDRYSLLATSLSYHIHEMLNHKGAETTYRLSLEYVHILGGRQIFRRIGSECAVCQKKRGQYMEQIMGHLRELEISVTPVFYATMMDSWGPFTVYCPGYERSTQSSKPYNAHMMVMVCCATGSVNCQIVEGLDAGNILDDLNRFFAESCVPTVMFPDAAGGMVKALTRGEVDLGDLSGRLRRERGIKFETCPPQGHSAHGKVERKIRLIQESIKSSGMMKSRTTYSGWQTIAKLVEREINETPMGYLNSKISEESAPLLRLLTPSSLRLQTRTDRAPRSTFRIPNHPKDLMGKIDEIYQVWYSIWARDYVPLIMRREKWEQESENLQEEDIVWFKLRESPMSAEWRLGKVESVTVGRDKKVREALVAYRNMEESVGGGDKGGWRHMTVLRPVRNIIKLYSIEDTTLMEDMEDVRKVCERVQKEELGDKDLTGKLAGSKKKDLIMINEVQGGVEMGVQENRWHEVKLKEVGMKEDDAKEGVYML